ncbi:flagellar hook-length control protein FliK [uncultured Brevundimonas sp.]|uniref:flagellar hook-length control protein FliK n=1 Tax=uncultured Brevundimonas sp. TaxID=213418 RepID=UPI0026092E93|nr:flagellar hook-length control protein FliK [uncultured Brevundimonas sp.]
MSALAILSVMTGNALLGASQSDVLDNGIDNDAALASAFADALEAADLATASEETSEDTDISLDALAAPVVVPAPVVPAPTRLAMNLPLTEADADAMMSDGAEAPAEPVAPAVDDTADFGDANIDAQSADAAEAVDDAKPATAVPVAAPAPALTDTASVQDEAAPASATPTVQPALLSEPREAPEVAAQAQPAPSPSTEVRAELPERLRNVPQKEIAAAPETETHAPAPEQAALDAAVASEELARNAEVVAERLAARPTTLPPASITPLPVEPAKRYAADGRMTAQPVETSTLDSAPEAADTATAAVADMVQQEASTEAKPSDANPKVGFDPLIAAATSHTDGDVVEMEPQPLEQQRPAEAHTTDTKGSLLSHATLRTTAELAAAMITRLGHRTTRFDMVLTPETLGNVEVTIEVGADGQMSARMAFDNPHAANEMRARADELRRQLAEAGFDVSENALEFTDRENDPRGGFNQFMSDGRSGRRAFIGAARLAELADAPVVPVWTPQTHARTGVDMKV